MAAPEFRLKRNGVVVLTWTPPSPGYVSTPSGSTQVTPSATAIRTYLDNAGGSASYSLEMKAAQGASAYYRSLLIQGVRR